MPWEGRGTGSERLFMGKRVVAAAIAALVMLNAGPAFAEEWSAKVAGLIAAKHSYPRSAQLKGEEGTAKIRISIDPSGKIMGVELMQTTGSDILDREAVRIPEKLGAVPPPPGSKPTKLVVPISWKLS